MTQEKKIVSTEEYGPISDSFIATINDWGGPQPILFELPLQQPRMVNRRTNQNVVLSNDK